MNRLSRMTVRLVQFTAMSWDYMAGQRPQFYIGFVRAFVRFERLCEKDFKATQRMGR